MKKIFKRTIVLLVLVISLLTATIYIAANMHTQQQQEQRYKFKKSFINLHLSNKIDEIIKKDIQFIVNEKYQEYKKTVEQISVFSNANELETQIFNSHKENIIDRINKQENTDVLNELIKQLIDINVSIEIRIQQEEEQSYNDNNYNDNSNYLDTDDNYNNSTDEQLEPPKWSDNGQGGGCNNAGCSTGWTGWS